MDFYCCVMSAVNFVVMVVHLEINFMEINSTKTNLLPY